MISPGLTGDLPTIGWNTTFSPWITFLSALSVSKTRWATGEVSTQVVRGFDRCFSRCFDRASKGNCRMSKSVVAIGTTAMKLAINDLCTIESDLTIDLDNSPDARLVHKVAKFTNFRCDCWCDHRHDPWINVQVKSCTINRDQIPLDRIIAIAIEPDILETRTPLQCSW